jgi:hypothetical protein
MSQPVLSDAEVRGLGEGRWNAKYGKRFYILIIAALLLGYGSVKLAQMLPGTPIGLIAGVVIVIGFLFLYRKYLYVPAKKAGEEFLKEWRL